MQICIIKIWVLTYRIIGRNNEILQNFETEQCYISSIPLQIDRFLEKNTLLKQYYYINYFSRKKTDEI